MTLPKDHPNACPRCWGDGRIASGEEGAPWPAWLEMPLGNAAAVVAGIVKPIRCPACEGGGERIVTSHDLWVKACELILRVDGECYPPEPKEDSRAWEELVTLVRTERLP